MHERAVDLQFGGRHAFQVQQAGIARAEVVDGNVHAHRGQVVEDRQAGVDVLHRRGLGDLQGQPRRLDAVPFEHLAHAVQKGRGGELQGRQVHCHRPFGMSGIVPRTQLRTGAVQHPVADRKDQAAAFGNGDEHVRRQQAQLRMLPAQQRLGASGWRARGRELGLVMQDQFIAHHGLAQVLQQAQLTVGAELHRWGEERIAVPPGFLGVVHRSVGVCHQLALVAGVIRVQGDAQAGADLQLGCIQQERFASRRDDPLGHHHRIVGNIDGQHDHELVAAEAGEGILRTQQAADTLRHRHQQAVAQLVPVGIVDRLEAVQVAEHHRHRMVAAPRLLDGLLDAVLQQHAVGQLGQRVVQGGLDQLVVGMRQRIGQQAGAHAHLPVEQRGDQGDTQRGHGGDDHQHRQPARVDATAADRAADAALREARRGHAGVVHADDGQAHHQRGQCAQAHGVALLGTQAECDPQRSTGGADGHRNGGGEPARVIVDARLHTHRGHAEVVHGGDAQPHQYGAGQQPAPGQAGP
uniref:Uncharacterized protein rhc1 n=1 Tax=Rhizobium arachis TaxID=228925 RepID=Q83ZQ1_9HYPH|nr:hypothetical protein 1 [Rhizobium arachis]